MCSSAHGHVTYPRIPSVPQQVPCYFVLGPKRPLGWVNRQHVLFQGCTNARIPHMHGVLFQNHGPGDKDRVTCEGWGEEFPVRLVQIM